MKKRIEIDKKGKTVTVRLKSVRLSFPSLFKATAFEDGKDPKYGARFIFKKEDDSNNNNELVQKAIKAMLEMNNKGKRISSDRICCRDGGDKDEVDGYDDTVNYLSTSNNRRPLVVDRDLSQLDAEDGKPYAGCYVNATVSFWWQDHKQYGKRVNANIRAVQFLKDGTPFGDSPVDAEEEFDSVDGEDIEDDEDLLG